jgi:2-polyprenyl-3-methyl-5-hydroxy-6-metoxy-1,4-benzoquinol methylase
MTDNMYFPKLPFIYELKKKATNDEGLPNFLPFNLEFDARYDLVKQSYNQLVDDSLSKAYQISSILGGNTTEDEFGIGYSNSILEFIKSNVPDLSRPLKILDIGCGTGYLLHLLKQEGHTVQGLEPGLQAKIGIEKYQIPIIMDFFPSSSLNEKYDLIISNLVLEHIVEPEKFLGSIKQHLNENGTVILGVPNATPYISTGDISILFHEHWSYFTTKSFSLFLKRNNATEIIISESNFGGLLYTKFKLNDIVFDNLKNDEADSSESLNYFSLIERSLGKLNSFFETHKGIHIGIYAPMRIVNFLVHEQIKLENIRFFDDNINSYHHYFPGIDIMIENFDGLKSNPTEIVLIMSSVFGQKIKTKIIENSTIAAQSIITWEEIFG